MSATTIPPQAATTPFSEAASRDYYTIKSPLELKVLAKLRCVSDAGEQQDIVARLMAQDKETGTWPGMYEAPATTATETDIVVEQNDVEEPSVAPVEQVLEKAKTPSGTKVTAEGKPTRAPSASVSAPSTAAPSTVTPSSTGSHKNGPMISMALLAEEWDQQWGAPYAFPRTTTVANKSRDTSVSTTDSVCSRSLSPITPAPPATPVSPATPASSPALPASFKANRYNALMGDEDEEEEDVPSVEKDTEEVLPPADSDDVDAGEKTKKKKKKKKKRGKKGGKKANKNKAAAELTEDEMTDAVASEIAAAAMKQREDILASASPSKAESNEVIEPVVDDSATVPEDLPAPASPARSTSAETMSEPEADRPAHQHAHVPESKSTSVPPQAPSFVEIAASKQNHAQGTSHLAPSPPRPATATKKAPHEIFMAAPPSPPRAAAQVPASPVQQSSVPTMSKNQRRNENRKQAKDATPLNIYNVLASGESARRDDGEAASDGEASSATAAKKQKKRGKKGGKKVQKKHQAVDVAPAASVVQIVDVAPVVQIVTTMPTKIATSHALGAVAIVVFLAALFGAWVAR